ncbi:hypothetical protein PR048_025379 [Dryococelus australis]|uniref:Uncharacterized protein n=1 Tax=Dryococelus australis TaxID=614101 RepID=A0ABQ9GR57_9NEOP|nr:hypothetical protein PR048_025379 [Dryococelus australis]
MPLIGGFSRESPISPTPSFRRGHVVHDLAELKGWGNREIPEKIRRSTASSGTSSTCENPVTRLRIEPGSPWWEASGEFNWLPLQPRVSWGISGFPLPFHSGAAPHTHTPQSHSSALKIPSTNSARIVLDAQRWHSVCSRSQLRLSTQVTARSLMPDPKEPFYLMFCSHSSTIWRLSITLITKIETKREERRRDKHCVDALTTIGDSESSADDSVTLTLRVCWAETPSSPVIHEETKENRTSAVASRTKCQRGADTGCWRIRRPYMVDADVNFPVARSSDKVHQSPSPTPHPQTTPTSSFPFACRRLIPCLHAPAR